MRKNKKSGQNGLSNTCNLICQLCNNVDLSQLFELSRYGFLFFCYLLYNNNDDDNNNDKLLYIVQIRQVRV